MDYYHYRFTGISAPRSSACLCLKLEFSEVVYKHICRRHLIGIDSEGAPAPSALVVFKSYLYRSTTSITVKRKERGSLVQYTELQRT